MQSSLVFEAEQFALLTRMPMPWPSGEIWCRAAMLQCRPGRTDCFKQWSHWDEIGSGENEIGVRIQPDLADYILWINGSAAMRFTAQL